MGTHLPIQDNVQKIAAMAPEQNFSLKGRRWNTDEVFLMLKEPLREQILRSLAAGGPKRALDLNGASGKSGAAFRKHLTGMVDAGFLVKKKNPDHGRQPFYNLAPEIVVCPAEDGVTMDFGCCMLRIPQSK